MRDWLLVGSIAALMLGCGTAEDSPELLDGFTPPEGKPGDISLITEIIHDIPVGADINYCTYLPFTADRQVDVVGALGKQSAVAGHHAILYIATNPQEPNTHECTEEDMLNSRYVAGAGGSSDGSTSVAVIPEGIAFRIAEGAQLFVQSHWVNTTDAPVDGQVAFSLEVIEPSPQNSPAQLLTVVDTTFEIPALQEGSSSTSCTFPEDKTFFMMGGHAHEWGAHVSLRHRTAEGETTIYDTEWAYEYASDPPMNLFTKAEPYVVRAGDTISVDCTWTNTEDHALRFPQEMCVGFGYYFPGDREINCIDGRWPTPGQ